MSPPVAEIGGAKVNIKGDIHALLTEVGVVIEGADPVLKKLEAQTDFVLIQDEDGKVYLRGENNQGADVDIWTAHNAPVVTVNIIEGQ
jgi:hypothetical protein